MVGFLATEATIKSKHFRREELILKEKHMFLAPVADGQTTASCGEGKKNCKHSPWVRFWVGSYWVGPWALVENT